MAQQPTVPKATNTTFTLKRRLSAAKVKEFELIADFRQGYRNREDITKLAPGILVVGSQDVVTDVSGRINARKGYTLDGAAGPTGTSSAPILSAYDFQIQGVATRHLRAGFLSSTGAGKLQVRNVATSGTVTWIDLLTNLNSVKFNFAPWFKTSTKQDLLLFVNGTSGIYEWSGGLATIAATSNATGAIQAIVAAPTVGGSGYKQGDILTITTGGTGATVKAVTVVDGALATISVGAGGSGYLANDIVVLNAGGSFNTTVKVLTVNGSGVVLTVEIHTSGSQAVVSNDWSVTGGAGTGLTVNVLTVSNGNIQTASLVTPGSGYTTGAGKVTSGGSGTGATIEISTVVNKSISINGTLTVAQNNFYSSGQLLINSNVYTYSGIVGNYFVGLNNDPTGEAINSVILQPPIFTLNSAMTDISSTFVNDLIGTLYNNVYVGSLGSNQVYVSSDSDYKVFSVSSPRTPGQGALLLLDSNTVAFVPQEDAMYVTAGKDEWYKTEFVLSADLTKEALQFNRLKTTTNQAAQSQALCCKIKDNILFLSNEPIINTLGRVDNVVLTPQLTDISYSIVNDINNYDFTDGCCFYFQKFAYVTVPKEGLIRVYNMTDEARDKNGNLTYYWEAPLNIPISRFSIIDGALYGHSYQTSETYKLFSGYNDNTHPIRAVAMFSYQQDGVRSASKSFNEFYSEGYITTNTTLTSGFNFDTDGFQTTTSTTISGSDTQIVGIKPSLSSIGKVSLGKNPEGGDATLVTMPPKFRVIKTFPRVPYYEYQPFYQSLGVDQQWSLVAMGAASSPTSEDNSSITE